MLSTLHTNDAPSSLTRLHDLGVAPFLTAATILGVMAQRLVRTLCPHCKTQRPIRDGEAQTWHTLVHPWKAPVPSHIAHATGCEHCRDTGYLGRIGLYEIMVLNQDTKRLISEGASLNALTQKAYQDGLQPLRLAGARKIAEGVTSFEEVVRVVPL